MFRSGSEEDYTELQQLLEDIQQYLQDFAIAKAKEMNTATQKRNKDKSNHRIILKCSFSERLSLPSTADLDDDDDESSGSNSKRVKTNKGMHLLFN